MPERTSEGGLGVPPRVRLKTCFKRRKERKETKRGPTLNRGERPRKIAMFRRPRRIETSLRGLKDGELIGMRENTRNRGASTTGE